MEGIGNYSGTVLKTFRIVSKLLSDKKIKASVKGEHYFNGESITLDKSEIEVIDNGTVLSPSEYEFNGQWRIGI